MDLTYSMITPANGLLATGALITDGSTVMGLGSGEALVMGAEREAAIDKAMADGGAEAALSACFANVSALRSDGPYDMSAASLDAGSAILNEFLINLGSLLSREDDDDEGTA